MNDFLIINTAIFAGIGLIIYFGIFCFLAIKEKNRVRRLPVFLISGFLFAAILVGISWLIVGKIEKGMSSVDKHSIGYQGEDLDRMTDFSRNRLNRDFRFVSFVYR